MAFALSQKTVLTDSLKMTTHVNVTTCSKALNAISASTSDTVASYPARSVATDTAIRTVSALDNLIHFRVSVRLGLLMLIARFVKIHFSELSVN